MAVRWSVVTLYALASGLIYTTPDANIGLTPAGSASWSSGCRGASCTWASPLDGAARLFVPGVIGTLVNLALHHHLWRRRTRHDR